MLFDSLHTIVAPGGRPYEVSDCVRDRLGGKPDDPRRDRIWMEWQTWALRGTTPAVGLTFLRDTKCLSIFPELEALIEVPQDSQWHPEGDVWTHTLHVCDAAAEIADREQLLDQDRSVLMLSALCHDPAPWFGEVLHQCLDAQLDGAFESEAGGIDYLQQLLHSRGQSTKSLSPTPAATSPYH